MDNGKERQGMSFWWWVKWGGGHKPNVQRRGKTSFVLHMSHTAVGVRRGSYCQTLLHCWLNIEIWWWFGTLVKSSVVNAFNNNVSWIYLHACCSGNVSLVDWYIMYFTSSKHKRDIYFCDHLVLFVYSCFGRWRRWFQKWRRGGRQWWQLRGKSLSNETKHAYYINMWREKHCKILHI